MQVITIFIFPFLLNLKKYTLPQFSCSPHSQQNTSSQHHWYY